MKVFFFIKRLGGGGAERVVANLASSFSAAGHDVSVINAFCSDVDYPLSPSIRRFFLEKADLKHDNFIRRNIRRLTGLRKILKKEHPDVLISFMAESNYRAVSAASPLGIKTVISVRNDPDHEYKGALGRFLAKHLLTRADGCVFQTGQARAWFPKDFAQKSVVIPNVVREDFFSVERKPEPFRVSALGRLTVQKNYPLLIKAFKAVKQAVPEAVLYIYGTGEDEEELKNLAESLGLKDSISFCGHVSDVSSVLSKTSVYVLSSSFEGMPNALMEALAAGVPSVSTDCPCGGPGELIESGKNGILVPPGDEKALSDAVIKLLKKSSEAEKMGQAAREKAQAYRAEKVFPLWEEYVKKVLKV